MVWAVFGLAAAAAAAGVVVPTAGRHNRFLAAGLVTLAAAGTAVAGVVFAPTLARLLAAGRARAQEPRRPRPAAALLAPLVAGLLCSALFFPVAQTRLLAGTLLVRQAVWAAVPALLLPAAIAATARIRLPISWLRAGLVAGVVYGGAAITVLALTWTDNLRFAPWTEIMVGLAIAIVAGVGAWTFRGRLPATPLGAAVIALGAWVAAAAVVAGVSRYEPARKTAGARAAFVGVTLDAGRRVLDFDGDGFARALGGGDCDDSEPTIHPGALDLPGDGIDADCDGEDATDALPPPARMAELPASRPRRARPAARSPSTRCAPITSAVTAIRAPRRRRWTRWRRRGRCSKTAGRTRRRRGIRCRPSPPDAGRPRSRGTNRSGGRAWVTTC